MKLFKWSQFFYIDVDPLSRFGSLCLTFSPIPFILISFKAWDLYLDITKHYPDTVWLSPKNFGYIKHVEMEVFPTFFFTTNP
ncbi:hypothetical protein IEQ34_008498 [Dendrobium chrysotoxum]|uniref:Uncharacterized protein n=1 Tax=Dendrobium chrysotoxum TaxID=161865 RepID=A0AAV7GZ70_DENCH|nr:hypothetical protein IEQ34_008498 [Dendrobium chrysotoxum]